MNPTQLTGQFDFQQSPLYDTYTIAAAGSVPNNIAFFDTRTEAQHGLHVTNMRRAGQLVNGETFEVFGVAFHATDIAPADLTALIKNYGVELKVVGKTRIQGTLDFFPAVGGPFGAIATTAATTTATILTNGAPSHGGYMALSPGNSLLIETGQSFEVVLRGTSGFTAASSPATGIHLRCFLIGIHGRAAA